MRATVQARLSIGERNEIARLVRQLGWSASQVVREGLRLVAASHPRTGRRVV